VDARFPAIAIAVRAVAAFPPLLPVAPNAREPPGPGPPLPPLPPVRSYGSIGGNFESFPSSSTTAHSVPLPIASAVTSNLSGDPNVTAAYNSPDGKTPLALVALNLDSPNNNPALSMTMSTSASLSFDVSTLQSGKLLVGLLDPTSSGPGFTSLHFSISREGEVVEAQDFVSFAAATTYFNDHVLDLGPLKTSLTGALDLTFFLEMSTLDNNTQYGINFLAADVGLAPVAEGDFNNDGEVDAADYVAWRKSDGGNSQGYTDWRENFGESTAVGSAGALHSQTSAPEPATLAMMMFAAAGCSLTRGRAA
jgi:hypothetical protein